MGNGLSSYLSLALLLIQNLPDKAVVTRRDSITVTDRAEKLTVDSDANRDAISVERGLLNNLPMLGGDPIAALTRFLDPSMGAGGQTLIVDGMEARNLGVTASAIQEIKINQNPYTAEYPRWSRRRIEVITKSGTDRYHGTANFLFRDQHLNARDAFAAVRPPEQRRTFEGSLLGPVGSGKRTSFLLSGQRENDDLQAIVFASTPQGQFNANVETPSRNTYLSARLSHAPNDRHAFFAQLNFQDRWQNNLGVGGVVLPEAGYQSRFREDEFIFNHRAVLSPKLLVQWRALLGRYSAPRRSNVTAPRVVVSDAFSGGGAQMDELRTEVHGALFFIVTQTAKRHNMKYGLNLPDWSRRGLSDRANQLGTYNYANLADYLAQRPFSAIIQRGDPKVVFVEKTVGYFFQDEYQARRNLSVAWGVRYDYQNYFTDGNNIQPRLSIAWAPGNQRNWVIRTGFGSFFERSGPQPIWDLLRFNGVQLRRYLLTGNDFNRPLSSLPTSVVRQQPGIQLPNYWQYNLLLERAILKKTTLTVQYSGVRGSRMFRSRDANAPLGPLYLARPDPAIAQLRQLESAGRWVGDSLEFYLRGPIAPKVSGMLMYVLYNTRTDAQGLNWFPASSSAPSGEFGRADTDRRHMFNFMGTAELHRWATFGLSLQFLSGIPYNITTGRDDNRDGLANDRPLGVRRNTGLGPRLDQVDLRWYHDFRVRPKLKEKSPTATLSVDAFNLLNHLNATSYLGAVTSPFFGRAVSSWSGRRIQLGARFQF